MKIKIEVLILVAILFLASVLRMYKLGSVPPSLTPDETAIGYNAYSILKTGRDEHGEFLPMIFKSFGDYKPGLYIYTVVPFVAFSGLNEFSTRAPGAVSGVLAVVIFYLLLKHLSKNEKLALVGGFLLAICPWHIFFSRGAWEINLALTLTLAGVMFFVKSFTSPKKLYLSALFFALTLLTYQGAKLSTSLVLISLVLYCRRGFFKIKPKTILVSSLIGLLVSTPIILSLFSGKAGRLAVFSVFSSPRPSGYLDAFLAEGGEVVGSVSYYFFHSEVLNFVRGILGRYFNHFSGQFLFFEGDFQNFQHSAPYYGMLNILDIPLLLLGAYSISKNKKCRFGLFFILWLLLAPLLAAFSRDQVHAVRSFNMLIPLVAICAIGAVSAYNLISPKLGLIVASLCGIVYLLSFAYFFDAYFVHLPKLNSKYWSYGYKQLVEVLSPLINQNKKIVFQQSYDQPYIYFLFYNKTDPAQYQAFSKSHFVESKYGDVGQINALPGIHFQGIDWQVLRGETGTIVVGDTERIPTVDSQEGTEFHVLSEVKYLDNKNVAFRVIEIK